MYRLSYKEPYYESSRAKREIFWAILQIEFPTDDEKKAIAYARSHLAQQALIYGEKVSRVPIEFVKIIPL